MSSRVRKSQYYPESPVGLLAIAIVNLSEDDNRGDPNSDGNHRSVIAVLLGGDSHGAEQSVCLISSSPPLKEVNTVTTVYGNQGLGQFPSVPWPE